MATTENNYTGDGSTTLFPFTFEYINNQDVKVQLDGTDTTEYTLANATTVSMNTAPTNGVSVRVYRLTDTASVPATFYSGSTIQASDLNETFNQTLFVSQEVSRDAANAADAYPVALAAQVAANTAVTTADGAVTTADAATITANNAAATAGTADTNALAAVDTANDAVATANAASAAVSSVVNYVLVADVAAIPSSPANGDRIEVTDSTGIESFTPLSGVPAGFTGDPLKAARITYDGPGVTWNWNGYVVIDTDARYAQLTGATFSGAISATSFTGPVTGDVAGNVTGDLTGNVTGDVSGNVTGNVTGDVTGNASGNAGTVSVTSNPYAGAATRRPIACWGTSANGGGVSSSEIKYPATNVPTVSGEGFLEAHNGVGVTGTISATGNISTNGTLIGTLGNTQVRTAIALGSNGNLGTYALLKKVNNGNASPGDTVNGSNLRYATSAGNSSGSGASGTWRCMGRAFDENYSGAERTTLWLRIS